MYYLIRSCRSVFIGMAVLAFLIAIPIEPALAALVSTQASKSEQDVDQVRTYFKILLAREDFRTALLQHRLDPIEIEARITALSDEEVLQVSSRLGDLHAGAGAEGAIALLLALGIFAVVVYFLVIAGVIGLGVYGGAKLGSHIQEQQDEEYVKTVPFPAPARVGHFPTFNPDEPWTGIWKVTDGQASGVYAFKQTGNIVTSTPESDHNVEAKILGAMIRGTEFLATNRPPNSDFRAIIADDYLSFKGTINRINFTCERVESKAAPPALKPSGPWAGKWLVQGAPFATGLWVLKQDGEKAISTGESYHRISGKALGDRLDGDVLRIGPGADLKLNLVLSTDGKTFKGSLTDRKSGMWQISGGKVE